MLAISRTLPRGFQALISRGIQYPRILKIMSIRATNRRPKCCMPSKIDPL